MDIHMSFPKFQKSPIALLDYEIDWTKYLQGDTIVTATFTADTGLTIHSHSNTDTTATVWLTSGTAGTTYNVQCEIVTAAGRTDERSITIQVKEL